MTDGLNQEVQQAFAKLTRVPRPHLSERIRESIWGRAAPGTRLPPGSPAWVGPSLSPQPAGQRSGRRRVLVAAALVIAVAAAALLVGPTGLGQRLSAVRAVFNSHLPAATTAARPPSTPAPPDLSPTVPASSEPTAAPAASTPPSPTPAPAPAPAPLPGYSCSAQSGGGGTQSTMTTARVGAQSGFDRFVVEFSNGVPQFEVRPQDSATFGQGTLRGSAGLVVTLKNLTSTGYAGQREFRPGFAVIQEARLLSDSGGAAEWGIGLSYASCFHAWILGGPARLVIDVQH